MNPGDLDIHLPVPLTLSLLNISSSFHSLGHAPRVLHFTNASGLQVLDISFNRWSRCHLMFRGLTAIRLFDLSGNNCYRMGEDVFDQMGTLTSLSLSRLNLNPVWMLQHGARLLWNLTDLQELDLSYNNLERLQDDMLQRQTNLRRLRLSGN